MTNAQAPANMKRFAYPLCVLLTLSMSACGDDGSSNPDPDAAGDVSTDTSSDLAGPDDGDDDSSTGDLVDDLDDSQDPDVVEDVSDADDVSDTEEDVADSTGDTADDTTDISEDTTDSTGDATDQDVEEDADSDGASDTADAGDTNNGPDTTVTCDPACSPTSSNACDGTVYIPGGTTQECVSVLDAVACEPVEADTTDCADMDMLCTLTGCEPAIVDVISGNGTSATKTLVFALDDVDRVWFGTILRGGLSALTEFTDELPADALWPPATQREFAVFTTASGDLYGLGLDANLGIGDFSGDEPVAWETPTKMDVPPAVGTVVEVQVGPYSLLALNDEGDVYAKGLVISARDWELVAEDIARIYPGNFHYLLEKTDGSFQRIGSLDWVGTPSATPVAWAFAGSIAAFEHPWDYGCLLDATGQAYCYGRNDGRFGDDEDTTTHSETPVSVDVGNGWDDIASFNATACVLDDEENEKLTCWGYQQQADGDDSVEPRTLDVGLEGGLQVLDGTASDILAVGTNGRLYVVYVRNASISLNAARYE